MIEPCDNSPEDKNFPKICRELMQQPLPYLDQRRTGAKTAGGDGKKKGEGGGAMSWLMMNR